MPTLRYKFICLNSAFDGLNHSRHNKIWFTNLIRIAVSFCVCLSVCLRGCTQDAQYEVDLCSCYLFVMSYWIIPFILWTSLLPCRDDFERTGLSKLVTVGVRDIQGEGFPEEFAGSVDAVFLDLPQPWLAIPSAAKMLKQDATLCSFSPCIEQVQRSCETLRTSFTGTLLFSSLSPSMFSFSDSSLLNGFVSYILLLFLSWY